MDQSFHNLSKADKEAHIKKLVNGINSVVLFVQEQLALKLQKEAQAVEADRAAKAAQEKQSA